VKSQAPVLDSYCVNVLNKQLRNTFISYLLLIKLRILNVSLTKCDAIFSLDFTVQIEFAYHLDKG